MSTVIFRPFEMGDVDFVYKCKNDETLNKLIVGQFRRFTRKDAENWVKGVLRNDPEYRFWAICTNDENKKMIGWVSMSEIDFTNKSACYHGIVIGDSEYRDGFAWIEAYLHVYQYAFEHLGLNRLYAESIIGHTQSNAAELIFFFQREGIKRQAIYKNDRFYDLSFTSILKDEYFEHKLNGDFELSAIIKRIRILKKKNLI